MRLPNTTWLRSIVMTVTLAFILPACAPPQCSTAYLVQSINNANSSPATLDTINLAPNCIYELDTVDNTVDGNNGLPSIISPIIINGNGATIRRGLNAQKQALRLFHVAASGDLTLNNVTLFDGLGMNPPDITLPILNNGGAVFNNGLLKISESILDSNRAIVGGGIYNAPSGIMRIDSTSLLNNQATIADSPLNRGGAIYNDGQAIILNSTLADNFAWSVAGGIDNEGELTITNSTLSGNTTFAVSGLGSAIHGDGDFDLEYSTVTNNGGGANYAVFVNNIQGSVEIRNSIIAGNATFDCFFSAPIATGGSANLDSDGTCSGFTLSANPLLDPLTNNGGPTDTHALQPGSPAIDAAQGSCPAADQRGQPRPQGAACDLGAYEGSVGPQPTPTGVPTATPTVTTVPPTSTPTVTATPAALVCTYTALENTNCRASDYVESELIAILLQGEMGRLIGLNPEYTHGKFELSSGDQCWIWLGLMDGPPNPLGECGVPAIDPPPPPTPTPTPVCRRDMDQATCTAVGGTWSATAAPPCTCP